MQQQQQAAAAMRLRAAAPSMPFPGNVPVTQAQGVDPKTLHAMLLMQQMKQQQQQQQQAQVQAHARSLGAMANMAAGQSGIGTNNGPQPGRIQILHSF